MTGWAFQLPTRMSQRITYYKQTGHLYVQVLNVNGLKTGTRYGINKHYKNETPKMKLTLDFTQLKVITA